MFDFFESSYLATFIQITFLHIGLLISPGPNFAIVTHNSLTYGRRTGLMTAVGIAAGGIVHLSYIIFGFGSIITNNLWMLLIIKFCGCIYLVTLGVKMLFAKQEKLKLNNKTSIMIISSRQALLKGALTNFLNPKVILFFLSIFSIVVDIDTPLYILFIYGASMSLATLSWLALVAILFSHHKFSYKLTSVKHWIERTTGGILILLSIKLALTHETTSQ